jgi:hypothetical protein
MQNDGLAADELYDALLVKLRELGADPLVDEIEGTVARGVVIAESENKSLTKSSSYRPMDSPESLAVALEFVTTALEAPLMVVRISELLNLETGTHVTWRTDGNEASRELLGITVVTSEKDAERRQTVHLLAQKLIGLVDELGLCLPEIA